MEVKEYALSLIHWKVAQDPWTRAVFLAGGVPLDSLAERTLDIASSEDPEGMMIRSLERWERILGITPATDATLEERRAAVRMRWLAAAPPSVESLQAICEAWRGGTIQVGYDPGHGRIQLRILEGTAPREAFRAWMRAMDLHKPAHLAYRFRGEYGTPLYYVAGQAVAGRLEGIPEAVLDLDTMIISEEGENYVE